MSIRMRFPTSYRMLRAWIYRFIGAEVFRVQYTKSGSLTYRMSFAEAKQCYERNKHSCDMDIVYAPSYMEDYDPPKVSV